MDTNEQGTWGERLAQDSAAAGGDERASRRLIRDALGVVRGQLGVLARQGVRPLLDQAAAQVRPATLAELHARYPGLDDDQVAKRLIDRAARTAAGVALTMGSMLAAQEAIAAASAVVPPAAGAAIGSIGVSAAAEVLVLFVLEAKLRADLGALAGRPARTPRELAGDILGEVQAHGGLSKLRGRSLRRALPEAATRRMAVRLAALVPARFARIIVPEVMAPLVGAAIAARLAARQVRGDGRRYWAELGGGRRTTAWWGTSSAPSSRNGGNPGPGPGRPGPGRPALPPPPG